MLSGNRTGRGGCADQKKIEKNLTNAAEFSIMYIESERDDSPLGLEMRRNIDVQHFETIASKGLKVINMV